MVIARIIPSLLLKGSGFVKTVKFKNPTYLGDPINILRIFNEKEVDEIAILDITVTPSNQEPNYSLLEELAGECFMPLAYGGGVKTIDQMRRLFHIGYEKVVLNTVAVEQPSTVKAAADAFGSQSIVVSLDVQKNWLGKYHVITCCGARNTGLDPVATAVEMARQGAGEILVTSVDLDGTFKGYDLPLIKAVTSAVDVPVIASGGAGSVRDLANAVKSGGACAAAAGSMFVFHGPHRAVLINVPSPEEIEVAFSAVTTR